MAYIFAKNILIKDALTQKNTFYGQDNPRLRYEQEPLQFLSPLMGEGRHGGVKYQNCRLIKKQARAEKKSLN